MAEQWEQAFKGFGEKTYTIAQAIQNANEGDDLTETLKVRLILVRPVRESAAQSRNESG